MLLHTDNLPQDHKIVSEMEYIFEHERLFIVVSESELVFLKKARIAFAGQKEDEPGYAVYQTEFPRAAASWIVSVIEGRLWKSESNGGLPSGVNHVDEDVAGENLKIRRSMNVGGPGQKGFYFTNFSRPSLRYETDNYQEIQITDALLREGGLMDVLRKISPNA